MHNNESVFQNTNDLVNPGKLRKHPDLAASRLGLDRIRDAWGSALKQISSESDRAAAIVLSSMLEEFLYYTVSSRLKDDEKIRSEIFRPSGPMGSFAMKIKMAYMMGLVTEEMKRDLLIIKDVRNDFAHNIEAKSFAEAHIKDKCTSLRLINNCYFLDTIDKDKWPTSGLGRHFTSQEALDKILNDPRERFLAEINFFCNFFVNIAINPARP